LDICVKNQSQRYGYSNLILGISKIILCFWLQGYWCQYFRGYGICLPPLKSLGNCLSTRREKLFESKVFLVDNFWEKNRAWQEIANIVNAGNSVKRYIKEMGQYMCNCKNWGFYALFFSQKLSTRKTLLSNNFSLLVLLQQYNFVSICPIWLPLRHFFYFQQSRIITFKHTRPWMFIRSYEVNWSIC
jgi:hypothetical protein